MENTNVIDITTGKAVEEAAEAVEEKIEEVNKEAKKKKEKGIDLFDVGLLYISYGVLKSLEFALVFTIFFSVLTEILLDTVFAYGLAAIYLTKA